MPGQLWPGIVKPICVDKNSPAGYAACVSKPPAIIDPRKHLLKLIQGMSHRQSTWEIFTDFLEMYASAIANAVDLRKRDVREARYMQIVKKYTPEQVAIFPQMCNCVTMALQEGFDDVLGKTFHELELHNKYNGQFFTPYELCKMMSAMTMGDNVKAKMEENGFITMGEPACGSGAMAIACADVMKSQGLDYQQSLHITCTDVDLKCVHMAYIQLSLLGIPAVVIHGNTLSLEEWDRWYTPMHILFLWDSKLRRRQKEQPETVLVPDLVPEPVAAAAVAVGGQMSMFG